VITKRSHPARPVRPRAASPRPASPRVQVSEMQCSRLLGAAVMTIDELGWSGASVAHITARARVSRRTFYDLFANREDCLLAVLDDVVERLERELAALDLAGCSWRERVRTGLWTILCFFDREPVLARVCVAQSLQGGPRILERREVILARLAAELDRGREESSRTQGCPPLTAEGLVGAIFAIVHTRLARGEREPLAGLLGELMGMIVLPYLGAAASRREQARPAPGPVVSARRPRARGSREDPLAGVPMRLTYRTARVLEAVAERPGGSNRLVAECAGISDQGQVSKLMSRLQRLGLLDNTGAGHVRGERNQWRLTKKGALVTQAIRAHAHNNQEVAP
jgi:AcrR family transcriptional regulator